MESTIHQLQKLPSSDPLGEILCLIADLPGAFQTPEFRPYEYKVTNNWSLPDLNFVANKHRKYDLVNMLTWDKDIICIDEVFICTQMYVFSFLIV